MADNTTANIGTGGDVFAAKDILGVKYPRNILTTSAGVDITPLSEGGSITVAGTVAVTGPITDAQIRLTPLPVSATFFQATQPVSLASMPSTPVTGVFWQVTQPVSGTVTVNLISGFATEATLAARIPVNGQALMAASVPVTLSSNQSALPVTGTFFQVTQPVSGTVAVNTISGFATEATLAARIPVNGQALMAASMPVTLASNQSALPVTGTFFQATQPVSIATMPSTPVTGTFFQATQPVSALALPLPSGASTETTLAALNTKVTAVNTGATVLAAGTAVFGSLVANQSVNSAQIAGVAMSVGSGISGTGVQRMVLATDVTLPAVSENRASTLHVTVTALVNTGATLTLPAPSAGLFHYITSVQLVKLYAALGVASAAGVIITSTNLPGSPIWTTEQIASALGTAPLVINYQPITPLKSSVAATSTTFVAPIQLQTIWRWNVSYFTAA